jgi:YesN/AraC family two-component response regulator
MKLYLLNRSSRENSSFTLSTQSYPHFLKIWHNHPELELVLILKSTGTRFIGDSIEKFKEGEIVLLGKGLPHMWLNDERYYKGDEKMKAEAIAVHFREDFLGAEFFNTTEMKNIGELLNLSCRGIVFRNVHNEIIEKIKQLQKNEGFKKTLNFLEVLQGLSMHKDIEQLSSVGFANSFEKPGNKSLAKVYEFIFENFKEPISAKDAAKISNISVSSFSRYFKRIHRKTFTSYLNEIRIGYACKLLLENKESISEICFESGFSNISNFNRQFRKIKGLAPRGFIQKHTNKLP